MSGGRTYGLVILVGLIVAAAVSATGQTQRSPATLDDLLAEMQGLRADLARSSSASVRVQVLTARLSLQEQRINDLGRQLTSLQARLDEATAKRQEEEDGLKQWEAAIATGTVALGQQKDMEQALPGRRTEVARLQAAEQQLRSELANLSNVIGSEQSQWTDFSNRLDDLERSLPSGR